MMNSEELKIACEKAKLEWDDYGNGFVAHRSYRHRKDASTVIPIYDLADPALPAYVAERLVGMAKRDTITSCRYLTTLAGIVGPGMGFTSRGYFATAEDRIRACMAVLP
jgi:hypothetical protein